MAITPKVRAFYKVEDSRVFQIRTLKLQELAPEIIGSVQSGQTATTLDDLKAQQTSLQGQIRSLQQIQIPGLQQDITRAETALNSTTDPDRKAQLARQVADLKEDLDALNSSVRSLTRQSSLLQSQIDALAAGQSAGPTRTEILSEVGLDPQDNDFILVEAEKASGLDPRLLRVIEASGLTPASGASSLPIGLPDGTKGQITEKGRKRPVVVITKSLDTDLKTPRLLVQVIDPTLPSEPQNKKRFILPVERTAVAVKTDKIHHHYLIEDPPGVIAPLYSVSTIGGSRRVRGDVNISNTPKAKIVVSGLRNEGLFLSPIPVENSTSARRITDPIQNPGISKIGDVSSNTWPSDQMDPPRDGEILSTQIMVEQVDEKTGKVQKVPRHQLQWKPPEMTTFGLPVVIEEMPGKEQKVTLYATYDIPVIDSATRKPTGVMTIKELKLDVMVVSNQIPPRSGVVEKIVVRSTYHKTPDGRPLLGQYTVREIPPNPVLPGGALPLEGMPSYGMLASHPVFRTGVEQLGLKVPVQELPVDDQGLFLWHDTAHPTPAGRENPTAVFQRRYVVHEKGEDVGYEFLDEVDVIQIEGVDENLPIWIIPKPTDQLLGALRTDSGLRPYSTDTSQPDFKIWPYQQLSPINIGVIPEVLASDSVMRQVPEKRLEQGKPAVPVSGIPFVRSLEEVYFFFVVDEDFMKTTPRIDPTRILRALERIEDGTVVSKNGPSDAPLGSFTTNTDDAARSAGEVILHGEAILAIVYPQKPAVGDSKIEQRIAEIQEELHGDGLTDLDRNDLMQELTTLLNQQPTDSTNANNG